MINRENRRRTLHEVVFKILSFCREKRYGNEIFFKCNLAKNFDLLDYLADQHLLDFSPNTRFHKNKYKYPRGDIKGWFVTTEKGYSFLHNFRIANNLLGLGG